MTCLNNIRQIGIAMANFATSNGGKLPLLRQPGPGLTAATTTGLTADGQTVTTDANAQPRLMGWQVALFPYLDNVGAIEYVQQITTASAANYTAAAARYDEIMGKTYKVFTCPDDQQHMGQAGGLSYAVNTGYGLFPYASGGITMTGTHNAASIDWNQDTTVGDSVDRQVARATGVFWTYNPDGFQATIDRVATGDGTGQTIMAVENLNSGSLSANSPLQIGFAIDNSTIGLPPASGSPLTLPATGSGNLNYYKINSNKGTAVGAFNVPSSLHPTSVNALFCDGSAKSLSEQMDWRVYASLITPLGVRYGQTPVDDNF
jgi:prepilin-type processing-associated H-X9-DG protein